MLFRYGGSMPTDKRRQAKMLEMRDRGASFRTIAKRFNITRQRAEQICSGRKCIYQHLRSEVVKFYKGVCSECGGEGREVHHIDRDTSNNKKDNLVLLCINCHKDKHKMLGGDGGRKVSNISEELALDIKKWGERLRDVGTSDITMI